MAQWLILRRNLARNAVEAVASLYSDKVPELQTIVSGDGQTQIQNIHLAAYTPTSELTASGLPKQWQSQNITLELHARCDYQDRKLDPRYLGVLQALEDFCARSDLASTLTDTETDGMKVLVVSPVEVREEIEDGEFTTIYVLSCMVRGKDANGD